MENQRKVTVLLLVHNREKFLRRAVESILSQTFGDFEFLIINDASTDGSEAIIRSYRDPRIKFVSNEKNLGLVRSCNLGLEMAAGEYIALMHDDDIALPERLERQFQFLESHPQVGVLGTAYYYWGREDKGFVLYRRPLHDLQLRWSVLLTCPIICPTAMIRRRVLNEHNLSYDQSFQGIEDYEFWTRILKYTRAANIREPLLIKRGHGESATSTWAEGIQLAKHSEIALRTIRDFLPEMDIDLEQVKRLCHMFLGESGRDWDFKREWLLLSELYLKMLRCFVGSHREEPAAKWLRCRESLNVLRFILCSRKRPGCLRTFVRMVGMDPAVLFLLPGRLLSIIIQQLKFKLEYSA